ncbi:MAG: hypothetical protein QOE60_941 [Thermoleophilaceae bacterium]|nr:hypothetical protein [Thermoleophilaceae bacterium]
MSQAYNARDLTAYLDTVSESVKFESRFSAMDRVVYRGHDDLRHYFVEIAAYPTHAEALGALGL